MGEEPDFSLPVPVTLESKKWDEERMDNTLMLRFCYESSSMGSGFQQLCTRCGTH